MSIPGLRAGRSSGAPEMPGLRIEITGHVQGVGFRPWVWRWAREAGIAGAVWNHARGVTVEAWGEEAALAAFAARLREGGSPSSLVEKVVHEEISGEAPPAFTIRPSAPEGERRPSIPADLATCASCLAEIRDPANRRFRYPFTTCTDCGPRFTIATGLPFDRENTTMAAFPMCADCRREYTDPGDRRFHAATIACPACGPRARLVDRGGAELPGDPLVEAARLLRQGAILAVKGLGGYHLACDAAAGSVVQELRRRKGRDGRPFAVMVGSLDEAHRFARVSLDEARLLAGPERPIVLLEPRSGIAPPVAAGAPRLGLFLPYTPLHHLLLDEVGAPVVLTSGNRSGEPIVAEDALALERLGPMVDALLVHDRAIARRADDGVVTLVAGRPTFLRRSRGQVPRPLRLARRFERPVLALGASLKNAVCIVVDDLAWFGPHTGDLETVEAVAALEDSVDRLERLLGVRPEIAAFDLHPACPTARVAARRPFPVGVYHHHAHVAAVAAEHGILGPVAGIAWDGTGYGPDGASWGSEILRVDGGGSARIATWRPIALPGGDLAAREVWRTALSLLDDAFEGDPPSLTLFDGVDPRAVAVARAMVRRGVNAPLAHGMGRLFDAFGAIGLGMRESAFEGHVAMAWEAAAEGEAEPYEVPFAGGVFDHRPMTRAAVADLLAGVPPGRGSARFHESVARAAAAVVGTLGLPVVAGGGCLANARLAGRLVELCGARLACRAPPGDGGIALGQAWVAGNVAGA